MSLPHHTACHPLLACHFLLQYKKFMEPGDKLIAVTLHSFCYRSGYSIAEEDQPVAKPIAPLEAPSINVITIWFPVSNHNAPVVEVQPVFKCRLNTSSTSVYSVLRLMTAWVPVCGRWSVLLGIPCQFMGLYFMQIFSLKTAPSTLH